MYAYSRGQDYRCESMLVATQIRVKSTFPSWSINICFGIFTKCGFPFKCITSTQPHSWKLVEAATVTLKLHGILINYMYFSL